MLPLQKSARTIFMQLTDSIRMLSADEYVRPCKTLQENTIGQHVRHVIELFQCLESGYALGSVNYEKRKRDKQIETDRDLACSLLNHIFENLGREDKPLLLSVGYDELSEETVELRTNYYRELAYNLEHAIHHMALMRVGINEISNISLDGNYGVAYSTIKHRKQCVQ